MVNNNENERESSPPQAVKKRATRSSTQAAQGAPTVGNTSFTTSAFAPGGDSGAAVQGQGSMKYQMPQTGRFEDALVGAAPAATTAQAGVPPGYQFGSSINASPASGATNVMGPPTRKKSAATKSSGTTNPSGTASAATESTSFKLPVRISLACSNCRRRKIKCVKVEDQDRCDTCEKTNKSCIYEPTSSQLNRLPPGEDDSSTSATTKATSSNNTTSSNSTKNASKVTKTSKVSKADSKMGQTQDDMANDADKSNTAATAYSVGDEGSPDVVMTDQTAPATAPAPAAPTAPTASKRNSGLELFDNSGGFEMYQEAADGGTTSFFDADSTGTGQPNLDSHAGPSNTAGHAADQYAFGPTADPDNPYGLDEDYLESLGAEFNTAGALLDQFEFERNAWPDEYPVRDVQDEPADYNWFDDPSPASAKQPQAQSAAVQPEAVQPEAIDRETGRESPKITVVYRGPVQAPAGTTLATQPDQNAFAPAAATEAVQPSAATTAASQLSDRQSFQAAMGLPEPAEDDYTETVASYLQNPVLIPGTADYAWSCAKLLYLVEKARADKVRRDGGGAGAAAELEQLDARAEVLRQEAVEKWEVANAGRQEGAWYDRVGFEFLRAAAPK